MRFILLFYFSFLCVFIISAEMTFQDDLEKAEYFKEHKEYLQAAQAYRNLLSIDPKNYYYLTSISKMYKEAKDYEMAISYYQRLLHLYPLDTSAKFELGQIYYFEKKDAEAVPLLEEVVAKEPDNFRAIILLLRMAIRNKEDAKAMYYLSKAEAIDKSDEQVWKLASKYYLSKQQYYNAYKYLFNTYQTVSSEELEFLVWDLRPYIYPSINISSLYAQERERDLVENIMTTEIDTWNHKVNLTIPLKDYFRIVNTFHFGSIQQINLVNGLNNYFVDVYHYLFGVEVIKEPHLLMKIYSGQKWGKNKPPVIFPFYREILWEPSVMIRYSHPNHLASISGYKDSYMGRHFSSDPSALFVKRKLVEAYYEFRDSQSMSSIGILANVGSYQATEANFRKLVSMWARYDVNPNPFHMVFEYKYEFSTFKKVDPDYSSYRAGYIHQGKISLIRSWKNRGFLDCHYTLLWNKRRDLINESVAIVDYGSFPNELKLNIYTAHIIECVGSKNLGHQFNLDLRFSYYMDSNDYRAALGQIGLQWLF